MVHQEQFNPTYHLCVQDVTPSLTAQSELSSHYHPSYNQQNRPFQAKHQCNHWLLQDPSLSACTAWDLIQSHQVKQTSPAAPFFQLSGQPHSRDIMVGHIKGLLAKLGLNHSSYNGHSLHIGQATTAAAASLRVWGDQVSRTLEEQHISDRYKRWWTWRLTVAGGWPTP